MKKNLKNGFTLVELLAVIVILAIILVIAVPKVMSVIEDSKKATLESTAKMIASTAEKQKVQNTVLGNTEEITCDSVAKINKGDYTNCSIEFDNNIAKVTIKGSGKFEGLWVCSGTKTNAVAIEESCGLRTLTVNLNGGTDTVDYNSKYEAGSEVTLTEPTKEGYTFNGWTVTGTGASVNENKLTMGSESTTVTATWKVFVAYGDGDTYIANLLANESELNNGLQRTSATYTNDSNEEITIDAGIRYVGPLTGDNAVKNQVYFNCEETDGTNEYGSEDYKYNEACEIWRIIGVFEVEDGSGNTDNRIKIINTNSTFSASWDSSVNQINSGLGINQWGPSGEYLGADLMQLLNGYYIEKNNAEILPSNKKECKYNKESGQSGFSETCDTIEKPLSSVNMKPLTTTALSMIDEALWYTYALEYDVRNSKLDSTTVYLQERGMSKKYTGCASVEETITTECTKDNVTRNNKWIGLVGLMSASDVIYANTWLSDKSFSAWTITPSNSVFTSHPGYVLKSKPSDAASSLNGIIWPATYLSPNVQIIGGDGSEGNAFKLKLEI